MTQSDATAALEAFRPGRFTVSSAWMNLWVVRDSITGEAIVDSDLGRATRAVMAVEIERTLAKA